MSSVAAPIRSQYLVGQRTKHAVDVQRLTSVFAARKSPLAQLSERRDQCDAEPTARPAAFKVMTEGEDQ